MVLIKGLGKIFVADFVHSMTYFVTATFCENVSIKTDIFNRPWWEHHLVKCQCLVAISAANNSLLRAASK